jgi:hypothetical protein
MKKGKTSQIQGFKSTKVVYGTVDSINFKSLYLNLQTWVEPTKNTDNWNRVVLNLSRSIKHIIHSSIDRRLFDDNFIVDLDLRSSGLITGKKSFLNLEVNFYLKQQEMDFKSIKLRDSLKEITKDLLQQSFNENEYFKFHPTKNGKRKEILTQIETL